MHQSRPPAEFSSSTPVLDLILEAWSHVLVERGPRGAVLGADGSPLRTFAEVEKESRDWESRFAELPVRSVVGVQIGNSPSWPAIFLAILRTGHVTLPLGTDVPRPEQLANIILDTTSRIQICGDSTVGARLPEAITFLKLTSGTTGTPRAIRFTSRQLAADCAQICETMGITPGDVNFGTIPITHSYGFSNLLTPLLLRGVPLALSEDRVPRAILSGITRTKSTVFAGTPVLFQHLAGIDAPPPPHLRLCISAGAPLQRGVWENFRRRFALPIHVFYGSSECGGIAYSRTGEMPEEGFVGQVMEGVTIKHLADERIEVRSAAVGDGYFPNEDQSILGSGRFIPGDLVRESEPGLVLVGRSSEFINVGGQKVNPIDVERCVIEFPGVRSAVVFAVPSRIRGEEPIVCVAGEKIDRAALLRHCVDSLPPWQVPRDIWLLPDVPTDERGKISRRRLAEIYLDRREARS